MEARPLTNLLAPLNKLVSAPCQLISSIERGRIINLDYRRACAHLHTYNLGYFSTEKSA